MRKSIMKCADRKWYRVAAVVIPVAVTLVAGCSPTHQPEPQGTISLRLYVDNAPGGDVFSAPVQFVPDSAVVRVFRGGTGVTHEVSRGVAINGASSVDVSVTCIAEAGKKVSVELYSSETMIYFGVDQQVDVVENENTDVMIDAYDIHVNDLAVSDQLIDPGDPPLDVFWNPVPAADSYLLLESSSPNFEEHLTQSFLTTDTVMTRSRPAGPWYYMVAPLNPYAVGSLSNMAYAYVVSTSEQSPQIDDMNPREVVPGDRVTLSGVNLDVPGRVWLGAVVCPTVSASETELEFVVPASGRTGAVSYENLLNTVGAPGILVVDRIAYVTRSNQDESNAQWYVDLIRAEGSINSGVAVVPLSELTDRNMRVFDLIIIADDVGTPFGMGQEQVQAVAESGAQVMAIGHGGIEYVSQALADVNGLTVTRDIRRDLYIPEGSLSLFQTPYPIAPSGPSTQQMCVTDQYFAGIDIGDGALPASVTTYAALSETDHPNSYALLKVEVATQLQQTVQNVYWGYEGYPEQLTSVGSACVTNVVVYLMSLKTALPAAAVPASP
jgi:hypothetical protein